MSDEQESSVLFSLQELMSIEEERIKSEEEDRKAAEEAAEQARLEAERKAREEEEARIQAEEERRMSEEQRVREEQARLEALRNAEMEKARAETEQKARMEAMTAQQSHERQLAALKQDKGKKRLRYMIIGIVSVVVLVVGIGGWRLSVYLDEQERISLAEKAEKARITAALEKEKAERARIEKEFKEKQTALQDKLDQAGTPEERERLKAQLKDLQESKASGKYRPRPGKGGKDKPSSGGGCEPGDPLCASL